MEDLVSHMQEVHCPYACNICFMHFSVEFKLFNHRQKVHQIGNLGLPPRASDRSDQLPEPPAGPDAETDRPAQTKGNQVDQLPKSGEQAEPQQAEPQRAEPPPMPVTPKKDKEVKGHKTKSEVYCVVCKACDRYFKDKNKCREHVGKYHSKLLEKCKWCNLWYMGPWDYNQHLELRHFPCKLCDGYVRSAEDYDYHCKKKHGQVQEEPQQEPEPEPAPQEPTPQVSEEPAIKDTSRDDRPHKCRYCGRGFKKIPEMNMHISHKHRMVRCQDCGKKFVTNLDRDNHRADVHDLPRFHCRVAGCDVYTHNLNELHEHMRSAHCTQMRYRCNKCPAVFKAFSGLDKHHEKQHDRVRTSGVMVELPCPKCSRSFKDVTMFINHSRDHEENQYECEECKWCFESYARLHGHCRSTHDMMKFSCDTHGEDFNNNEDLCRHATCKHVLICHVCRNTFVSESDLQGHLEECHGEKTPWTREQMIEDKQAEERLKKQRQKEERKRKRKKKKKKKKHDDDDDDDDDDEDEDETYHPSQDYGDDSTVDPEYLPTKKQLRDADKEGDR